MEAHALPRTGRLFLPRSKKLLAALSDERLVEQVRRGNEAAFEVVFDRHHRGILSFCRHMLASPDEAEDAVQQTFISAFDSLQGSERDVKLKAWLYTIARNRCLSILRARREQPAELDDVPTVGLAEEVQQRSDLRELLDDLRGLPVDQRAALVLSEIGDLSHADVGAIVGCEAAKVKSLVFQARSSLIESRRARDIPCSEIREQLATATGGALRRGPLRRHLRACEGCAEFRDEVMRQRKAIALLLPVIPSLGLKKGALAALGIGGGGGAGGAAAGLGGGGIASLASSSAAVKVVAVVVASVAVGGGIVLEHGSSPPTADAAQGPAAGPHARASHPSASGPGAIRAAVHGRAAHAGGKSKHSRHAGGSGSASRKRGNSASAHNGTGGGKAHQHAGHGQSGGAVTQQGPGSTPAPVAPGSGPGNGAGNGIGNAGGNGNGNAGGNGNGAANGNAGGSSAAPGSNGAAGYDHSAHGGQGVGNGGTPPGQADNPHSNAGGNGNGSASSNAGGNGKGNGKASGTA